MTVIDILLMAALAVLVFAAFVMISRVIWKITDLFFCLLEKSKRDRY